MNSTELLKEAASCFLNIIQDENSLCDGGLSYIDLVAAQKNDFLKFTPVIGDNTHSQELAILSTLYFRVLSVNTFNYEDEIPEDFYPMDENGDLVEVKAEQFDRLKVIECSLHTSMTQPTMKSIAPGNTIHICTGILRIQSEDGGCCISHKFWTRIAETSEERAYRIAKSLIQYILTPGAPTLHIDFDPFIEELYRDAEDRKAFGISKADLEFMENEKIGTNLNEILNAYHDDLISDRKRR
jgi:hypothetical protein